MTLRQDMERLVRYAEGLGWVVERDRTHYMLAGPDGQVLTAPKTPSEYRSFKNTVADFRRAGMFVPRKNARKKQKFLKPPGHESFQGVAIAKAASIVYQVPQFPHISAILGQWRNYSWFDDEGRPLSEEQWPGYADEVCAACVFCGFVNPAVSQTPGGGITVLVDAERRANLPKTDRLRRIWIDAFKFWDAGTAIEDRMPDECSCGMTFLEYPIAALGQHIVDKHERGDTDHAPIHENLSPWTDPEEVELILTRAADEERIAELEEQLAEQRALTRFAKQETDSLKRAIRSVIE